LIITNLDYALVELQIAHSVKDVAAALKLEPDKFFYVVQNCDNGSYYQTFTIPKKTGGERVISKPTRGLALAQDRLAQILNHKYRPRPFVKGFVKGESFLTNARYHEKQRWILNIDIKDFFPTIGFARVRGVFMSNTFSLNPRVATILARICTYNDGLPQGASTSPILANFIAHNLDKPLIALARQERVKYSRYADDITFSSNDKGIPQSLITDYSRKYVSGEIELGHGITDAFARSSFSVNEKKSRLLLRSDRQEVTGLIVNEKTNVWRRDISKLRMKIYSAQKCGVDEAAKLWISKTATGERFSNHIVGWLAFIRQVRGSNDPVLAKLCKQAVTANVTNISWIKETADMVREFDVFLSHASEDKPKIRKLKDGLETLGIKVFFDEDSIKWGDSIVGKINIGLLKSTYFMPFLTNTFSNKGWTNKELNSAISMNASQKGRILPIKTADFNLDERYPLLNETLYKTWPQEEGDEERFIAEVCDHVLAMIETAKQIDS
jgi:RNA-directed DNA polymerase